MPSVGAPTPTDISVVKERPPTAERGERREVSVEAEAAPDIRDAEADAAAPEATERVKGRMPTGLDFLPRSIMLVRGDIVAH